MAPSLVLEGMIGSAASVLIKKAAGMECMFATRRTNMIVAWLELRKGVSNVSWNLVLVIETN